jgi:hypothetical protein
MLPVEALETRDSLAPQLEPVTVRIGVTGHRTLIDAKRIASSVKSVLDDLDRKQRGLLHRYLIVSPLAEGADRLVARVVLNWKGKSNPGGLFPPRLKVVLPMTEEPYYETFSQDHRQSSIDEFKTLFSQAAETEVIPAASDRHEAYERVGRKIVENCDVLIAIWDGRESRGRGGTAEIVAFAKASGQAVFWVHAETGAIQYVSSSKDFVSTRSVALNEYNREELGKPSIYRDAEARLSKLQQAAAAASLDPRFLHALAESVLPNLAKASRLAQRYQKYYYRSSTVAYILSACAVAIAVALELLFREKPALFLWEAAVIALVIFLVKTPKYRAWHRKWLEYRYVAERLRAACFLYPAGLREDFSQPPPDLQITSLSAGWIENMLRAAWTTLSLPINVSHQQGPLARFLGSAWIEHQRDYYLQSSRRNHIWGRTIEFALSTMLLITLASALLHALDDPFQALDGRFLTRLENLFSADLLFFIAVAFPAFASALAGISVMHHFDHNSERYKSMGEKLDDIGRQLRNEVTETSQPDGLARIQQLVREADRYMAHEHQGWRVVFGIQAPGPG